MTDIIERLRAKAYDVKPQDILNSKGDLMLKAASKIAELEALLGRYANGVDDQNGTYFEPGGPEGVYIIELAERAEAKKTKEKP